MMILKWQPPGAVTLSVTSVEIITDAYQRTSRWKGGLNTKAAKATAHKGDMSKMTDISKSTVKLLEQC